jgi:hypothetical protein
MANIGEAVGKISPTNWNWGAIGGTAISWLMGIGIFLLVCLFGWWGWSWWKNKNTYIQPVRLIRYLENGSKKEVNGLLGGEINVQGIKDFEIKQPKKFKKHRLGYIPDYSKMDADGRLIFITIGDGKLWQQVEEEIVTYKEEEIVEGKIKRKVKFKLLLTPIPTEVKTSTLNSLRGWREILDKKKITVFGIGLGMFIIMVIAHLISLYIQTKVKCPLP